MTAVSEPPAPVRSRRTAWPVLVRDALLPVAMQAVLYTAVGVVNASRAMHDETLLLLEQAWFGTPWRTWAVPAACAAVSGATTPSMRPLPKLSGSFDMRRAMP